MSIYIKSYNLQIPALIMDFTIVTLEELAQGIQDLPSSTAGSDGTTVTMIKILFKLSPCDLLNTVNYSLNYTWIPYNWKLAKIILIQKRQG